MISEREKEFEDGLFFGALATEQKRGRESAPKEFAGINLDEVDIGWD